MALRKRKSTQQQIAELAVDYLKLKTASKVAKGAGKSAKKAAKGTAVYQVAKKKPFRKRIPVILGATAAAGVVATMLVRSRGGSGQPQTA